MSQPTYRGRQGLERLRELLLGGGLQRVLLVTGGRGFSASGAEILLGEVLGGLQVTRYSGIGPNPKIGDVERGLAIWEEARPEALIAVGGGSVIDVAKLLKAFRESGSPVADAVGMGTVNPCGIPLFVVPTTAGSGSEATHFAVIYRGTEKFSVAHGGLLPDAVFLVPDLLRSLPAATMAASGADALCQAVESYWSIHSTGESRGRAERAMRLVWGALEGAVRSRGQEDLERLSDGANLAGQAIDLTKTTAPHAVSYALTSLFGISHGQAVSVVLPGILRFNLGVTDADVLDRRGRAFVLSRLAGLAAILGVAPGMALADHLECFFGRCGLAVSLRELGVGDGEDIEMIVRHGFNPERVNNNPRKLTRPALQEILRQAYSGSPSPCQ